MARRWIANLGKLPSVLDRKGARCFVRLANGREPGESWEARTIIWRTDGHPFSVTHWARDGEA